ncbi:MAG: ABC transporter ATP-binding protein [Thermoleophilia bacterium]|jgi:ABC-type multidrug transport system fused ATPase/permease subunit
MDQGQRFRWPILVLLSVINSVLEVAAAALVYVLVGLVANPNGTMSLPLIGDIRGLTGETEDRTVLLALVGIMIVFFLIRAVAAISIEYIMARVTANSAASLATKLVRGYLSLPYSFHLQRNSSELIRNGHQAVIELVGSVFAPLIRLTAEVVMAIGILILLVLVSPIGTAVAIVVIGGATAILMFFVQPRLRSLGKTAHAMHKDTLASLQQSFGGVRDIKVLGRERFFSEAYGRGHRRLAHMSYLNMTLGQLPRLVIETSLVWFILIYFAYTVARGLEAADTLSVLGLFGYAGLRLQPSLQKIVAGFNSIKYSTARTEDIHQDLRLIEQNCPEKEPVKALLFRHEIKMEEVSFAYEGADCKALSDVNLTIRRGEQIGICGPTGGGKSTLIDLIIGLLSPSSGRVLVDGRDIAGNTRAWQQNLGVVPQMVFLIDDSLRHNIALGLPDDEIDAAAIEEAVKLAQLEDFIESLPEGLDTIVGERGVRISGGERQRIAIARALYRRPEVLIFDEGTSALDNATEQGLMDSLTHLRGTHTILLVAHRLSTVRDADRVIFVENGRVAGVDTFDKLCESNASFRQMALMN